MSEKTNILNLDDLVADAQQGGVELGGTTHHYADGNHLSPLTRHRLNWLWRQILQFETSDEEPTEEAAERYGKQVDEALGIVLPTLGSDVDRIGWSAKTTVLLDFFGRQQTLNQRTERLLASLRIGEALSQRSSGSTAVATRKAG